MERTDKPSYSDLDHLSNLLSPQLITYQIFVQTQTAISIAALSLCITTDNVFTLPSEIHSHLTAYREVHER